MQHLQVVLEQDHVGGLLGYIHRRIHRDADVRRMQRWRVIDAVAEVAHHMPPRLEGADHPLLLGRVDAAEQVGGLHPGAQRGVVHRLDVGAGEQPADGDAQLGAHVAGHQVAVAGDDLDGDAGLLQRRQRRAGARLGRVEEGREAGEHQLRLVADDRVGVVRRHLAPGDAQHAEAFGLQAAVLGADGRQGRVVEGALELGAFGFVVGA